MEVEPAFSSFQLRIVVLKQTFCYNTTSEIKQYTLPDSYAMVLAVALTVTAIDVAVLLSSNTGPLQSFLVRHNPRGKKLSMPNTCA